MGHRITLDIAKLDAYYEKMMDEVYLAHHQYPSCFNHIPVTAQTQAAMNEAEAYARGGKGGRHTFGVQSGKGTRYECDPDYSNGLPRHK